MGKKISYRIKIHQYQCTINIKLFDHKSNQHSKAKNSFDYKSSFDWYCSSTYNYDFPILSSEVLVLFLNPSLYQLQKRLDLFFLRKSSMSSAGLIKSEVSLSGWNGYLICESLTRQNRFSTFLV